MDDELRDACFSGDAGRVAELLAAGRSPDEPLDTTGMTPLMAATSTAVVDALLAAGASTAPTWFGNDALQVVVSDDSSSLEPDDRLAAAHRLLDHGAPLDRRNEHGWSRLYVAAFGGDLGAVRTLLALGADADDDPPPLAAACWGLANDPAATAGIVDALIDAGADVHRRDGAGWTLLHAAAMPYSHGEGYESSDGPDPAAIEAVVRHGVDPDAIGPGGQTALMLVAADGELAAVEALLAAGADPDLGDDGGRRAVDHARDAERRLSELLATATSDTADAVRSFRDRTRQCADRLSRP